MSERRYPVDITTLSRAELTVNPDTALDSVTVLRTRGPLVTKTWLRDGTIKPYDEAAIFTVDQRPINGLLDLAAVLAEVERDPRACVIRGALKVNAAEIQRERLPAWNEERKRNAAREGKSPPRPLAPRAGESVRRGDLYDDVPHHWVMLDVDGYAPRVDPIAQPVEAINAFIRETLPEEFHGIDFFWQLSSSAGHADNAGLLKAHLFFWLREPATSGELKAWAQQNDVPIDKSVFNAVQVHFVAAPVFEDGVEDPVPQRSGLFESIVADRVALVLLEAQASEHRHPPRAEGDVEALEPQQIADFTDALGSLDPDDRDDWISVILNANTHPELYEPVRAWSARSPKHSDQEFDQKWAETGSRGHWKAILTKAQSRGWQNPAKGRHPAPNADGFEPVDGEQAGQGEELHGSLLERDFDMNDAGNVGVLIALQGGDLRYDVAAEQFIFWRNARWERDEDGTRMREAIKGVERYWSAKAQRERGRLAAAKAAEAGRQPGAGRKRADGLLPGGEAAAIDDFADALDRWSKACGNLKQINAIVALAKVEAAVVVDPKQLDQNPYLLGVENGVVDLRTGELRPDARDEFVTVRCPVQFDPTARAPRWEQFQQEICGLPMPRAEDGSHPYAARPALVAYKRRWAGSMLIGKNLGQKFYTATGEGSNGKSLELETYVEIMGPRAVKLPQGAFIAGPRKRDADAASPVLSALRGKRLALASETEEGDRLNTGDVKTVTGDAEITARALFSNGIQFRLEVTPVLLTNHPPSIRTVDSAIVGRMAVVPYDRRWNRPDDPDYSDERPDADTGLGEALRVEHEGILAWMVAGAVEVFAAGGHLNPPPEVAARTDQYLQQQSAFGRWLETLAKCDRAEGAKSSELLDDLRRYCQSSGLPMPKEAMNDTRFGEALARYAERAGINRDTRTKKWSVRPGGQGVL